MNLSRVLFLTSEKTASASEILIKSLEPYMEVIILGENTHGKPVGMRSNFSINREYIYFLITFSLYNSNNEGEYFDGLNVTCDSGESLIDRDDVNEYLFNSALFYIENNSCRDSMLLEDTGYMKLN
jgi:hypothetical protein